MKLSVVLCPNVIKESSSHGGKLYRYTLLSLIPKSNGKVSLAIDHSGRIMSEYSKYIDQNPTWADILELLNDSSPVYFKKIQIKKTIRRINSVVGTVAKEKSGGNEVIAWDKQDYNDPLLRVFDRDEAQELLNREPQMKGNIFNVTMGDNSVFNTGIIQDSYNRISDEKPEIRAMLRDLTEFVYNSKSEPAGELLTALSTELTVASPKKSLLEAYWKGIVSILPNVKDIVVIADGIAKLLN
jgi:hypothetical protein